MLISEGNFHSTNCLRSQDLFIGHGDFHLWMGFVNMFKHGSIIDTVHRSTGINAILSMFVFSSSSTSLGAKIIISHHENFFIMLMIT